MIAKDNFLEKRLIPITNNYNINFTYILNKKTFLFVLILLGSVFSRLLFQDQIDAIIILLFLSSIFISLICLVSSFTSTPTIITDSLYAISEGIFLGNLYSFFKVVLPNTLSLTIFSIILLCFSSIFLLYGGIMQDYRFVPKSTK